jgi:hypothetical protein
VLNLTRDHSLTLKELFVPPLPATFVSFVNRWLSVWARSLYSRTCNSENVPESSHRGSKAGEIIDLTLGGLKSGDE